MTIENIYRGIMHNLSVPVVLLSQDNKVKEINKAASKLFRIALNQTFYLFNEEIAVFNKGEGQKKIFPTQLEMDRGKRYLEVELSRIADVNDKCGDTLVTVSDVSEHKATRNQLRYLLQAIEQSSMSIVILDRNENVEYVNSKFKQLTGYTESELIGKNARILNPVILPDVAQQLRDTIMSGKEWHGEFYNRKKDGELFWDSVSIAPVKDEHDQITHFVAVNEDITERKLALELLKENNKIMQTELDMAAKVQRGLLPYDMGGIPNLSFAWRLEPSVYISGDMLNIFPLDASHVVFYILDVMGHGVSAALRAITYNYFLKPAKFAGLFSQESIKPGEFADIMLTPSLTLELLNEHFTDNNDTNICTILHGIIDTKNGLLTYARAGHCPPFLLRKNGEIEELRQGGPAIGISKTVNYTDYSIMLEAGDKFCLYTDGVSEAQNGFGKFYSKDCLMTLLRENSKSDVENLAQKVIDDVNRFVGTLEKKDDLAFLVIEFGES